MKTKPALSPRPSFVQRFILSASAASLVAVVMDAPHAFGQAISIGAPTIYGQDFNTLPTTAGNWVNNATLPGWYADTASFFPATGILTPLPLGIYTTGAARASGFFSAGAGAERALAWGATTTSYGASGMGVVFQNTSANTLAIGNISFNGELYFGQSVANNLDGLQFFYQIGNTAVTSMLGTAVHTNGALYGPNAALDDTGWTRISALEYSDSVTVASQIQNPVKQKAISTNAGLTLAPGEFITLRWRSFNDSGTDAIVGIDDLQVNFLSAPSNLIYNRAHSVGGAPDGIVQVGVGNYWLRSGTPAALTTNDNVFFSQSGNATLSVPANVGLNSINVTAASGTYTFSGAGAMSGALIKSGAGNLVLGNSNTFSTLAISAGGTLQATAPQSIAGGISVPFDGSGLTPTIQTDADVTAGFLANAELLTKTGAGSLILSGVASGTGTGSVLVSQGRLRTLTAAALGPKNITINGAGTALVFAHAAGDQTLATGTTITPGATGGEINVESATLGAGVIINTADRLIGANTITKTGPGVLRMGANQGSFTGNWIINGGAVQYGTGLANAMGSGTVTINAGGELVGQNTIVPIANIVLSGGALGTRTGVATDFTGTINVTANSEARLRSISTPTGAQPFSISGLLTGGGDLTLTGNLPLTDSGGTAELRLRNPGNTFSGGFHATPFQTLTSEATAGAGSTLNGRPVLLSGGRLRVRDNGTADNGTIIYGNNVTVDSGVASVDVDRQITGAFSNNTVQLGTLNIATGSTLGSTGANGYQVQFNGATTVTGAGDVTFSPTTAPLLLAGGLGAGGFGVVKSGTGVLGINGNASYTGNTVINAGTFGTNGQLTGTPRIDLKTAGTLDVTLVAGGFNVGAGQTLAGTGTVNGSTNVLGGGTIEGGDAFGAGTLSTGLLTFAGAATVRASAGNAGGSIFVGGTNTLVANGAAGSVTVNVFGAQPTLGTHVLLDYDGAIGGTGFAAFALGSLPPRTTATLQNDPGNAILLSVTAIDFPIWKGSVSTAWSTAIFPEPKNWVLNSNNASTTDFIPNDRVLFDDRATAIGNVDVAINGTDVLPQQVTFDNKTKTYTLAGTNGIAGTIGLTKNGDNTATSVLTINNTNSFTGPVTMNAGTVRVAAVADSGVASPLGAGANLVFDGGTLEYTGPIGSTNRQLEMLNNGGTVKNGAGSVLTLAGSIGGSGGFTKSGAGTVIVTGTSNYTGTTTIAEGTLNVGVAETATPLGSGGVIAFTGGTLQHSVANANDYSLRFSTDPSQAYNVDTNGQIVTWSNGLTSPNGTLTKYGNGQLVLSGGAANTYNGVTTVHGGTVTLTKTSGVDAIGGDLVVNAGGIVSYGTTAGQLQDHIADTANIFINGGTFGSSTGNTDDAPTQGVLETVASVTVTSGKFLSGRYLSGTPLPFTITGGLEMTGGTTLVQRGAGLSANSVELAGPAVLNLDGGSTTVNNQSRLTVGAGGLTLGNATITLNAGPSVLSATAGGSIVELRGNVTSAGTSVIARLNLTASAAVAIVDLGAAVRTFDVTGTLTVVADVGTPLTDLAAAGILKTGSGKLALEGAQSYASLTNNAGRTDVSKAIGTGTSTVTANAGTVNFGASQMLDSLVIGNGAEVTLSSPLPAAPEPGAAFDGGLAGAEVAAVPEPGSVALLAGGIVALLGFRRRTARR